MINQKKLDLFSKYNCKKNLFFKDKSRNISFFEIWIFMNLDDIEILIPNGFDRTAKATELQSCTVKHRILEPQNKNSIYGYSWFCDKYPGGFN